MNQKLIRINQSGADSLKQITNTIPNHLLFFSKNAKIFFNAVKKILITVANPGHLFSLS